jgi:fatty acid desaturase
VPLWIINVLTNNEDPKTVANYGKQHVLVNLLIPLILILVCGHVNRVGDPKNEELHENAFEDVERYMRARNPRRRITPGIYGTMD